VICDSQAVSGACAAVTEALTAEVTSIPALDAPVAASRMSLISTADVEVTEASRELKDEVVLIRSRVFLSC
jgi:uncharacterized protein YjaG (DUF416 family)